MKKQNKRHTKRVRNLAVICFLCALTMVFSSYAWFIGMQTVTVSSFDINIASTDGLYLSMDGQDWYYNLDARNTTAYEGNTNTWATSGLVPMSSIGEMDATSSTMKLYEKASLTTTPGGYRLLASRVKNYTKNASDKYEESKGYVAFDLFIKNVSGNEYYTTNNILNEEDIYLTYNSSVKVSSTGGIAGTGIENSVRVAFAQIGRVEGNTNNIEGYGVDNITAITCSNVAADTNQVQVTGICRDAQIWEPNDKAHVTNAINWYDTSCKTRKANGTNLTLPASYNNDSHCGAVANGTAVSTYAIAKEIAIADYVDVYDGEDYNGYTADVTSTSDYVTERDLKTNGSEYDYSGFTLVDYPYFTDTDKNKYETARPTFMKLAPNSITKLRVYIYIEGQDIDNYDFASLGRQISVQFGFTKERYNESDPSLQYNGPVVPTIGEDGVITGA